MNDYRILVVDDEEDLCEILKFNLENEGYEVDTANSAEEALRMEHWQLQPATAGRDDGRNFRLQNGEHAEEGQEDSPDTQSSSLPPKIRKMTP